MYESKPPPPASALVLRTLEEGAKAGDEWSLVYRAILRQAAVDREVFQREIGDRDAVHAREARGARRTTRRTARRSPPGARARRGGPASAGFLSSPAAPPPRVPSPGLPRRPRRCATRR